MLPAEGLDAFAGRAQPQQVVLTSGLHTRHAQRLAEAFGCPIRTSREGAQRIGGALKTEEYRPDGDAPGARALKIGVLAPGQIALHLTVTEPAIALTDAVHHL